jgi:ATP-dependent Lon protease
MPSKQQILADKKKQNKNSSKNSKLKRNKPDSDDDDDILDILDNLSDDDETSDSSYKPRTKKGKSKNTKRQQEEDDEDDDEDDEDVWEDADDEEDEDDDEDDDEDEDEDDEEPEETVNYNQFQKLLSKMFPSKYMDEKVKETKSNKKSNKKADKKSDKKSKKLDKKKSSKKHKNEDESEDDDDEDDDEYEEEEDEGVYNIVFALDGNEEDEFVEDDDDVECNSDDEQAFMKENYQKVEQIKDIINESTTKTDKTKEKVSKNHSKDSKKSSKKRSSKDTDVETEKESDKNPDAEITDVEQEYLELAETKKTLTTQLLKKPNSKILKNAVKECDESIKELVKKARSKNVKTYHSLINNADKKTNEYDYFKKKLSNKEQLRIMKDLKEINSHINIEKPYRLMLLDSNMPSKFKAIAMQKLNILKSMDPSDNEYYKIKNWVDTFMKIPFGVYKSLTVHIDDGMERCQEFMENAKNHLDTCVHGLEDAKMQIMQMIGQWIANPGAMGSAIAITGPPGTGKTSLVKEGISKILGREFTFIALGGTGDASFLEGHSYTYEGSTWGKIVQILIDSKCMNPVIYFDELDKISETPRGEEIVGILTHLTDTSQNSQFHDKYFSEVDFDLSKCLFIFSYNDENKVNPILKDRMYRIQTKGYDAKEKNIIARDYLLPKITEQVNFKYDDIIIPDETIQYIISNKTFTSEESGVRNLKRCLEIIYTKLNLFRLMKPDSKILGKDMDMNVSFPFTVTKKEVDILIKSNDKISQSMLAMYV